MQISKDLLKAKKEEALARIYDHHLRPWGGSDGNIFFISDTYPGVWLEHTYDGVAWADYEPSQHEISRNQVRLFIKHQKPDGQLPCYIWKDRIGYGWTQECVSFGSLCLRAVDQNPQDPALLHDCYESVKGWIGWQEAKRMPHGTGLVEMFCGYDTGHDNSGRLNGMKYNGEYDLDDGTAVPEDDEVLPVLAPDMNACYYGNLNALSAMAERLGNPAEAVQWKERAEAVRKKIFEYCYNEEDQYFYDVDKNGKQRKIRSISITNVLTEGVPGEELGNQIFERYLHNPKEFWTPYPFPAISSGDPAWVQNKSGNSWGFYSQGLTCLRSMLWMEKSGHAKEMEEVMEKWVASWANSKTTQFGQELHPITGQPSDCSQYYSSCMLYFLHAIRRLYGI